MQYVFDHPWELGLLLAILLAFILEAGRRCARYFQIEQIAQRREQMGTIRDGLFILVSLLLGFSLTMAVTRFVERRSLLVEPNEAVSKAKRLQEELWLDASRVAQSDRTAITAVYLNSLNETIDLHEKRIAAFENRIPQPVWLLIISVSLIAVFTRGSTLTARFWLSLILLPITIAIVVALIPILIHPAEV